MLYVHIYIYVYIPVPVRTLLAYLKNRLLKIFLHVSPRCPLFVTDHIFGKRVSLIVFRQKICQNLSCGANF